MNNTKLQYDVASQLTKAMRNHLMMIGRQLDFIERNEHKIAQLDLDVMVDRIRKMYDAVCAYQPGVEQQMDQYPVYEEKKAPTAPKDTPVEIKTEKTFTATPEVQPVFVPQPEKRVIEPVAEPKVPEPEVQEKAVITEKTPEPEVISRQERPAITPPKTTEPPRTTIDLFGQQTAESLADKLVKEQDDSVAAKIQRQPISDLKMAIGINEKFLFVNELFGGSLEKYNQTIDELNSFKSFNGARTFLIEKKVNHQWEGDSQAFIKLMGLIERKFNTHA